jgi:hypothetical protein
MTFDTYTRLFEADRHGADVRTELVRSEFSNLLSPMLEPRLLAGEQLRATRVATPRLPKPSARLRRLCPPSSAERRS